MKLKFSLLAFLMTLILAVPALKAAPSVKIGSTTIIKEAINSDIETQLKAASNVKRFVLEEVTDADLAKLVNLFPDMTDLQLDRAKRISNLSPLANLKNLTHLTIRGCQASDLTPLSGLTELTSLNIDCLMQNLAWMEKLTKLNYVSLESKELTSLKGLPSLPNLRNLKISHAKPSDLTPIVEATPNLKNLSLSYSTCDNLAPLTKLANLEDLDLYGARVKDFSPLSGCPKLKKVMYYATKGADYATLGQLTQVYELYGGLSDLKDIAWIVNLPNLKKFTLFAEPITDYTPLSKTKLEYLKIWSMKSPVNLEPVSQIPTLKELVLWSLEEAKGSKALSGLKTLEKLTVNDYNKKKGGENFDLASATQWKNLKDFSSQNSMLDHFEALSNCSNLEKVTLIRSQGVSSLAPLKKLPKLKYLRVSKDLFPDQEFEGFSPQVRINK